MNSPSSIMYFSDAALQGIAAPTRFTFPFFYEPHALSRLASEELQRYLEQEAGFDHNFGLQAEQEGMVIGKMFGVLVVEDENGKLGYLWAFSGKLAGENIHQKFVPPVFDMLTENSFFLQEEKILNSINQSIKALEQNQDYQALKQKLASLNQQAQQELEARKLAHQQNKSERKALRKKQQTLLTPTAYELFENDLIKQSLRDKHEMRVLTQHWEEQRTLVSEQLSNIEHEIEQLKKERREKSAALQQQLFDQYVFLNQYQKPKSLGAIFQETAFGRPPAAAGECATPKLLQYAFKHHYKPVAMAEFWWGASPKSEIRKHKHYYPACTGKCEPILRHMLEGIKTDDNPFLKNVGRHKTLRVIFEDEHFIVVNKPSNVLSVPGIHVQDSVYSRLKEKFKTIEPLIIHRLDMATSGLLVVAKTKEAHKHIQKQFIQRTVSKRYTALLSKRLNDTEGAIHLPLRGDITDRPRQLVCFEHGKKASTNWKAIEKSEHRTLVYFWPLTGRTHQLRMHAAHPLGLNAPIVGDDLYGLPDERLYLHSDYLEFVHPATNKKVSFHCPAEFNV